MSKKDRATPLIISVLADIDINLHQRYYRIRMKDSRAWVGAYMSYAAPIRIRMLFLDVHSIQQNA